MWKKARSKVITYFLDSSSWIHGAMHVEERVECVNTEVTSQRLKIKPLHAYHLFAVLQQGCYTHI